MKKKKYTVEEFLKAAEIGEVSMIDARHIVSLLDEAVILERERKLRKHNVGSELAVDECKCIRFTGGDKWYTNGCNVHPNG